MSLNSHHSAVISIYLTIAIALTWLFIGVVGWLGWQLLSQNGRMLLRLDELEKRLDGLEFGEDEQPAGLPVGSEAVDFELPDLTGKRRMLSEYRGRLVLLIFFNPGCGFCRELAPRLGDPALSRECSMLLITVGNAEQNRAFFNENKVDCPVLMQKHGEVATAYEANGTPSGYLVSAEGKIASELAMGGEALLKLVATTFQVRGAKSELDQSPSRPAGSAPGKIAGNGHGVDRFSSHSLVRSKIKREGLKAGTPAPGFRLPRLDGRGELALSDLGGRRVLLVFSSPGCGPCNTLAPELEKFHREHSELEVVMISKSEPRENRVKVKEYGLTFPVVLQQQWEISRRYAMFATPIAYLIDEQGIIARDVAVGEESILDLMVRAAGAPVGPRYSRQSRVNHASCCAASSAT